MGTLTGLYPSSTIASTDITVTGAASAHAALDASTSSYLTFLTGTPLFRGETNDYTAVAGTRIHGVRVVCRYDTPGGTAALHQAVENAAGAFLDLRKTTQSFPSLTYVRSPYTLVDPAGAAWTDAALDAARIRLWDDDTGTSLPRIVEAYLEVLHYAQPIVSGVGVNYVGGKLDGFGFTFNGDGAVQVKRHVKVFTEAVASAGGFDPESSTPAVWERLDDSGATLGLFDGFNFVDDQYRVYVKAASSVGGSDYWSAWAFVATTQDRGPAVPTPQIPIPGAVLDVALGVELKWQYAHPNIATTQGGYALRRKTDGGAYEYWNAGSAVWQGTIQWNVGSVVSVVFVGGTTWANGHTYHWSVAVQDSDGDQSAFATDQVFTSNARPVVSITAPSATVTNTNRPQVTWTYSDAESNPQDQWHVRIFSLAQWFVGGFDPLTSPCTADSLQRIGEDLAWKPDVDIPEATGWAVFVRAHSGGQWSAWDSQIFDVDIDEPAAPSILVSLDDATQRYLIICMGADNLLSANTASMETSVASWFAETNASSLTQQTDGVHGTKCLQWAATAGGNTMVRTNTGLTAVGVAPGRGYTARVAIKAVDAARSCRVVIKWWTAAGAASGTPSSTGATVSMGAGPGVWVDGTASPSVQAVAPSDAAFASVHVEVLSAGAGERFKIDKAGICNGLHGADKWGPGGFSISDMKYTILRNGQPVRDHEGKPYQIVAAAGFIPPMAEAVYAGDGEMRARESTVFSAYTSGPLPGQTDELASSEITAANPVTWSPTSWWLRDVPQTDVVAVKPDEGLKLRQPMRTGVFYPEGQDFAVIVSDPRKRGYEGPITFWVLSSTSREKLEALLSPGRTLLLQDVLPQKWYAQVVDYVELEFLRSGDAALPRAHAYKVTANIVEVQEP
jgi:hypothetical protein